MHNCTLYAAFRLKENGFKDPGNWGDAKNWANAANKDHILVNQTPAVGSIAQWNAGGGGDGHVAYVESVSYASGGKVTAITITEDNFMPETGHGSLDGGYTSEVHINAGASVWPANFIHAKDQPGSGTPTAYVANFSNSATVTPIPTATNKPASAISVGTYPQAIAITPNGATAYVANSGSGTVTPISTATNTPGPAITVGSDPVEIAITPNGATAYVTNDVSGTVTPISTATNAPGPAITVGNAAYAIAISP